MKKFYSIVLMACAMLVSANLWAVDVTTRQQIQNAINDASAGQTVDIRLMGKIDVDSKILIQGGQIVNVDLNGHDMVADGASVFQLHKGSLNITGTGTIEKTGRTETDAIRIYGSTDPTDADYSVLTIGKDVTMNVHGDQVVDKKKGLEEKGWLIESTNAITVIEQGTSPETKKAAYGVKITINGKVYGSKYGVKINGNVTENVIGTEPGNEYNNLPYVHVTSTAEVWSAPNTSNSVAIYSSGVGRFLIEGYVHGASGVYVKAGSVEMNDAVVKSDYTEEFKDHKATKSGVSGGGSAITIESNKSYAGGQEVTIKGDTKVMGGTGYAVEETITNAESTKVSSVTVAGGTIEAGDQGAVVLEKGTTESAEVLIVGGNLDNNIIIKDGENYTAATVDEFFPEDGNVYVSTTIQNEAGEDVIVVTKLDGSVISNVEGNSVSATEDGEGVIWKNSTTTVETIVANMNLSYLQISEDYVQTLNVGDEDHQIILTVGRVVLGAKARVNVAAGSKVVITGDQGIVSGSNDNLLLQTKDGKPAQLLFSPAVISNRHPNATIEFISKSYRVDSDNKFFQRFGVPASLDAIEFVGDASIQTAVSELNYKTGAWDLTGIINGTPALTAANLNKTFNYYQMLTNAPVNENGYMFRMKGGLVGNESPELDVLGKTWYGLANSYMGKMDIATLLANIPASFENIAIYTYALTGANQYAWDAVNAYTLKANMAVATEIDPMQPFLVYNMGPKASIATNYADMVWTPGQAAPASAPRRADIDWTTAQVVVSNVAGREEKVNVIEGAEFTTPSTALKYMNEDMNLYVSGDEKYSIVSTDDMNNTYLGFSCTEAGTYTVNFKHLNGEALTLIDLKNGVQVAVNDNASYEFYAEAGAEDYRFVVVKAAKAPTALENANVAEAVAGVYSITGQYMGTMAEWNTLPAGIYVVNGEKRIR